MGLFEEILAAGARQATKASQRGGGTQKTRVTASPVLLKKAAKQQQEGLFNRALEEAGSFFRPAGTFAKNLADTVADPVSNLNPWGKANTNAFSDWMKQNREYRDETQDTIPKKVRHILNPALPSIDPAVSKLADAQRGAHAVADNTYLGYLPPVQLARAAMRPVDTWNRVVNGKNPNDGNLDSILGSRGREIQDFDQAQIQQAAEMEKRQPFAARMTKGTPLETYFDPNSEDIADAARKAGYSTADSLFFSMMNPGEWAGSEGIVSMLSKLSKAGKAGKAVSLLRKAGVGEGAIDKFNQARKAVNVAGLAMDPTQLGIDAISAGAKGLARGAGKVDWKLPGKRSSDAALPSNEEMARNAGVDPEAMARYRRELQGQQPASNGTEAAAKSYLDQRYGPAEITKHGDETQSLLDGLLDEASPDYYNRVARNIPDDSAPPMPRVEPAAPKVEAPSMPPSVAIPDSGYANLGNFDPPSPRGTGNVDETIQSLLDEALPESAAAQSSPRAIEDDFLMRESAKAAEFADAESEAIRLQKAYEQAREIQTPGRVQAQMDAATPSILPRLGNELPRGDASLEAALVGTFPASAVPEPRGAIDPFLSMGQPSPGAIPTALARGAARDVSNAGGDILSKLLDEIPAHQAADVAGDALNDIPLVGGENLGEEAAQLSGRVGDNGISSGPPPSAGIGLVDPSPAPFADAGSPSMGLVDSMPTHGAAQVEEILGDGGIAPSRASLGSANGYSGGIRLNSNPLPSLGRVVSGIIHAIPGGVVAGPAGAVAGFGFGMVNHQGKVMKALDNLLGGKVTKAIEKSKNLVEFRASLKRAFSGDYGKTGRQIGEVIDAHTAQRNAIMRSTVDDVYKVLDSGSAIERSALQQYMNGSMPLAQARQYLSQRFIDAGDNVRYLMDKAGNDYIATSLGIERDVLAAASTEEKQLIRQIYETFNNRQTNVGPKINLTRKQALQAAQALHTTETIQRFTNLIDGAMSRMEKAGHVVDGRLVDLDLDIGTWIANLKTYEPRFYMAHRYGVDMSSPTAAMDFVSAVEARHAETAKLLGVPHKPIPEDLKTFILSRYTGDASGWGSGEVADEAGRFMKRKDLSQELKDILGPMVNPAYSYMKGIQQVKLVENTQKVRRWISSQDGLVSRPGEKIEDFLKRTGFDAKEIAYDFAENPQFASQVGSLKGRFIHRDVADLMASTGIVPHTVGGDSLDLVKSVSRNWLAISKVILNPPSHALQYMQNSLTLYQKLGPRSVVDMMNGVRDIMGKSQHYLEARNAGIFSAGHDDSFFAKVDLDTMPEFNFDGNEAALAKIARGSDWLGAVANQAKKAYGGVKSGSKKVYNVATKSFAMGDDLAKLAAFKHYRRLGHSPEDAARQALEKVFTGTGRDRHSRAMSGLGYRSTFLDRGARSGTFGGGLLQSGPIPMPKFTNADAIEAASLVSQQTFYGAKRFIWESAVKGMLGIADGHLMPLTDPAMMARTYSLLFGAMGLAEAGRYVSGESDAAEHENMPDWMRRVLPTQIKLPQQFSQLISGDGHHDWLDLNSISPLGAMADGKYSVKEARMTGVVDSALATFVPGAATVLGSFGRQSSEGENVPVNPLLKIFVEQAADKDLFTNKTISTSPGGRMGHVYRSLVPPWAPYPAGLLRAVKNAPQRFRDGDGWAEVAREAVQSVAAESPSLASRIIAGSANSINYHLMGDSFAASGRIMDNKQQEAWAGKAFAGVFGMKVVTMAEGEMREKREKIAKAIIADMKKDFKKQSHTDREREAFDAEIDKIRNGQPSERWYQTADDVIANWVTALKSVLSKENKGVRA